LRSRSSTRPSVPGTSGSGSRSAPDRSDFSLLGTEEPWLPT
jgi:hypothetical protein